MSKSKSTAIGRQALLWVGMLAAAAAIILGGLTWRARHRLSDKVAALRSAGDPVSIADLAPSPIPASDNAAMYLQNISADADTFDKDYAEFYKTPLGEALDAAEERGEPPQRAYALKLLGDASLAKGDRSEAQSYLERALELATKCDMRPLMDQCRPALESARTSRAI